MWHKGFYRYWVVQFLLCLLLVTLTRLPYLLGQHVYFDGDEAILGIMAQDLLSGENIPVYFYGQQYGFSFFEVVAVAVGLIIFGNTVWALKFGGILIFSVGLSFLFRFCIKQRINILVSCAIILVISCFPAWLLWSTKPRGGYLTAFSISCILIYIFQTAPPKLKSIVVCSTLLAIGIHSQAIIIVPVAICYAWWILRTKKFGTVFLASLFLGIGLVLLKLPAFLNEGYWALPTSFKPHLSNLKFLLRDLPELFSGSFFYELVFPLEKKLWLLTISYALFGLLSVLVSLGKKNASRSFIVCLVIGGIISFLMIAYVKGGVYRYSLGLFTACLLIVFLSLTEVLKQNKKMFSGIMITLMIVGMGCSWLINTVPAFWLHPGKNDLKLYGQLVSELKNKNCEHVFILDPMMQWMLNYSGISSRCTSKKERINRYSQSVDQCYSDPTCTTALVGFVGFFNYTDTLNDWNNHVTIVNERFFVYYHPEDRHLKAGGFEQ